MSTSIVILGKGKSVLKSTKNYIDSFDKVAFINMLKISDYENYISTRCDYWFFGTYNYLGYAARNKNISWDNMENFDDYDYYIKNTLGIKKIFNIGNHARNTIDKYLDKNIVYDISFRRDMMLPDMPKHKQPYQWFPPSGIIAFDYFLLNKKQYNLNKISLVGFDFYKTSMKNEKNICNHYYFLDDYDKNVDNKKPDIAGIIYDNTEVNPHTPDNQIKHFIQRVKENPDIQFEIITDYKELPDLPNLRII